MAKRFKVYKQKHRKSFGDIAEWHVAGFLSGNGGLIRNRSHHYDMIFENLVKIEVKATQLAVVRTGFRVRRVNHGWTIYSDRHDLLVNEKYGYYALALMIGDDVIDFRFLHASKALTNLTNSLDHTLKPRIRLGTLYKALKPKEFLREVEKIKERENANSSTQKTSQTQYDMPSL